VDKPLNDNLSTWREKGVALSHARRLQQFEIADWLVEGTGLFPDAIAAYDFAERTFPDVARQTFINWVSVARQYPTCIRIQSDWLTFSHYQVALGAKGGIGAGEEARECAPAIAQKARLGWLQQANDNKLTVAELRLAITNEWVLTHNPPAQESEPAPEPPPVQTAPRPAKAQPHFLEVPVHRLLSAQVKGIQALANARRMPPDMLVVAAVTEYLEAHANEVADAVAKDAEENEHRFRSICCSAKQVGQQAQQMSRAFGERAALKEGWASVSHEFPDDEPAFAQEAA
jgi:hypothetical protein